MICLYILEINLFPVADNLYFVFFLIVLFIYFWLCWLLPGLSFVEVCGLLIVVASLVAWHKLKASRLQ